MTGCVGFLPLEKLIISAVALKFSAKHLALLTAERPLAGGGS